MGTKMKITVIYEDSSDNVDEAVAHFKGRLLSAGFTDMEDGVYVLPKRKQLWRRYIAGLTLLFLCVSPALAFEKINGIASWYDSDSVRKEGTCHEEKCFTASGYEISFLEKKGILYAASNQFELGTQLKVCSDATGNCTKVVILDRGGFSKYGRKIDLCRTAFAQIERPSKGLSKVSIQKIGFTKQNYNKNYNQSKGV